MKNFLSLLFIAIALLTSCQKSPINGDLDGQWQVMTVTPQPAEEVTSERIYMCFSLHTCQLTYYGNGPWTSGNILKFADNTLALEFPYATSENSIALLRQYGINSNPVSFTIETLTKDRLILRDGDTVIELRKF